MLSQRSSIAGLEQSNPSVRNPLRCDSRPLRWMVMVPTVLAPRYMRNPLFARRRAGAKILPSPVWRPAICLSCSSMRSRKVWITR